MVGYARAWRAGVVVVCALLALPVSVLAATTATWSTTGRPLASLDGPGVLLPTGKVLAVDVNGRGELYDPRAQTWALTGSTTVRGPLTLLANGHVLVVGDLARVAQEYNPQTGTWTTVGAPLAARTLATFTPLPNGKILIAGGVDGSFDFPFPCCSIRSAELYDPSTHTFSPAASMPSRRAAHFAILLATGNVLVGGGFLSQGQRTGDSSSGQFGPADTAADLYDPVSATWTKTGAGAVHMGPAVALLADGRVLVAGSAPFSGAHFEFPSPQSSLYEPRTGTWKATTPLPDNSQGQAFILPDGSVDVVGPAATFPPVATLINAQRYDPRKATWTASDAGMTTPLGGVSGLPDGSVLGDNGVFTQIFTPPATRLPTSCTLSLAGTDATGHAFIRIAARDISSGLKSVNLVQATNATVALPRFASLSRGPAVTIATKVDPSQPSTLTLQVTNAAGRSITCDPVLAELRDQRHRHSYILKDLPQAENKVQLINRTPGLDHVELRVNSRRFRVENLTDGEARTLQIGSAMVPGNRNTIEVQTHGPRGSSALLVISD